MKAIVKMGIVRPSWRRLGASPGLVCRLRSQRNAVVMKQKTQKSNRKLANLEPKIVVKGGKVSLQDFHF